jgi:hypothetical protein
MLAASTFARRAFPMRGPLPMAPASASHGLMEDRMRGSKSTAIVAAAALALLIGVPASRAEDVGDAIKKGAQDTGAAIEHGAKEVGSAVQEKAEPVGQSIKQGAQDVGTGVEQGAHDTGNFLDRSTRDFRDGASNFFHKVGNFFSGK